MCFNFILQIFSNAGTLARAPDIKSMHDGISQMSEPQVKKPKTQHVFEQILDYGLMILVSPGILYEYMKWIYEERRFKNAIRQTLASDQQKK